MCSKTTCRDCSKVTWAGCGQHVDQVMRGVPKSDQCSCSKSAPARGGKLSRLWSR